MTGSRRRIRTGRGALALRSDAVGIRTTPGRFLDALRHRWRRGGRRARARVAVEFGGFLASLGGLAVHLARLGGRGPGPATVATLLLVGFATYTVWSEYLRTTVVPLSTVDVVTVDDEAGEVTVVHHPDRGRLAPFADDRVETTLSIPAAGDVREVRAFFRRRGVDVRDAAEAERATTHRVVVEDGATFCEACRSQVSPGDGTCPACGYAVRVPEPVPADGERGRTGADENRRAPTRTDEWRRIRSGTADDTNEGGEANDADGPVTGRSASDEDDERAAATDRLR